MARRNAAASAQPAPATIDLGTPEPPPAPPTSADIARTAPESGTRIAAKTEPTAEPVKVEPASAAPEKIDPPKPPMPSIEAAMPASPAVVATSEQPKPAPSATAIDLGQPEPPPAPPTSADIARADADAWPASTVDQVTAIQRLLRDLNFSRDPADGIYGPATRAAIVDFERTAGLAQTGEPSKVVFDSLKDMRSTMQRKSPASP
jgi:outer membrane biosynthesis protein TonB